MSHYTMLPKYDNCTRLLKIKNKLKIGCFSNKVGKNSRYFVGVFIKTIIPLALVGYEMIIANDRAALSIISYLTHCTRILLCMLLSVDWLEFDRKGLQYGT